MCAALFGAKPAISSKKLTGQLCLLAAGANLQYGDGRDKANGGISADEKGRQSAVPKVTNLHKTEVRERIIQAAIESFGQTGFDRTKMDDIAKRLGVSKGTLYLYFNSKEDLFIAISDYYIRMIKGQLESMAQTRQDLVADAAQFYETFRRMGRPGDDKVMFEMMVESTRNTLLKKALHEHRQRIHDIIVAYLQRQVDKGFFRKDIDADSLAWGFMSVWVGLTIYKLGGVSESTMKKAWAAIMRSAYGGMSQ